MPKTLTYDCPNCLTHYVVWDELTHDPFISPEKYGAFKAAIAKQITLGYCKKCKRDDGIRTTFEMDGLYTTEDIQNRFFIMMPCVECGKYTKQDKREHIKPCQYCKGEMGVASNYHYSIRTWSTSKVVTPADRKKMGRKR